MEEFDTRAWYKFTDKDGNTFSSLGDNGFVQQSIKEGVPISVNENGDWYIEPYLENKNGQVVAHLPEWFKSTNEYEQWKTYAQQIPSSLTDETFNNLNDIFKGLSSQGLLRNSLKNDIASFGVTDANLQNKYVNDIVQVAVEGKGGGAAQLNDIYGSDQNESAADLARSFKNMSKEELSSIMTNLYETMRKGQNGTFTGTQKQMLDAVTTARILNYIDDNYSTFGTDNEFQGLLEMSTGQKFQRAGTEFMQTLSEGPLGLFTARLVYLGTNGSMKIEDAREEIFSRPLVGGGLEGGEGAQKIGSVAGTVGNIAVTMATSMLLGNAINAKLAVNSPSGFWGAVGNFAQTIAGGAVTDFFLHDVPVDLIFAADDLARTGSIEKAWYNPEEEQPLFGIPVIGSFGPRVPGGLAMNLAGDATIDAAIPILAIAGNTAYKQLDDITGGGVSRTKEKIAVKNLEIQNKLAEIPVLGTGWQKFMNYMMGAENAQYIREARKAAIAEGSMEPYVRAQNTLTLKNHAGGEVVAPMYKKLDDELGVTKSAKEFLKEAEKYGGVGETRVEWKEIKNGVEQTLYKAVPDTLPRDVKQGLLDVERLSELKGEIENEGGVPFNPAREKEIAEIEKRLESTPQEIKDFADRFSELNKRVEAMGIDLGVTTEEWIDALQMDPRWDKYMVRQALVPGNPNVSGGSGPEPAIWNKSRKGYYADNYISPDLALNMKVEALGRAYAWNEQAKSLVAFEVSQGKVIAGKGGVDVANRLAQVKQEVKMGDAYRKSIDYDTVLNNFHKDTSAVNDAFRKVNDLQNLPNKITLKAVYDNQASPRVKELVNDFNSGKIRFGEGVKEAVGVSDSQAAAIINNTFVRTGDEVRTRVETKGGKGPALGDILADSTFDPIRNANGEIDAGVDGLTFRQKKRAKKAANKADDLAREEWSAKNRQDFEIYQEQHEKWLDGMREYVDAEWKKLTPKQQEADPLASKLYDKYEKTHPEPKRPELTPFPESESTEMTRRDIAIMDAPEKLVDSKAPLDFIVFDSNGKRNTDENNFNFLTRGTNRRALYQKGYDNLDAETKAQIDKADAAFTQRTTANTVFYRGEDELGLLRRKPKVGDELDTSAWTYTQFLPEETTQYRHGSTATSPASMVDMFSEGVLYRYHVKEGTPVFFKPGTGTAFGDRTEFILPRGIKATVTNVEKGFSGALPWKLKNATIVDVEVDATDAVTPSLKGSVVAEGGTNEIFSVADNVPQSVVEKTEVLPYNAGMTQDGIPFKYTLEGDTIASLEEITDPEEMAKVVNNFGGVYKTSTEFIEHIGPDFSHAINRALDYYKNDIPPLPTGATFKTANQDGVFGWIPTPGALSNQGEYQFKIENGHIVAAEYPLYLESNSFKKGNEARLLNQRRIQAASGAKPKNSQSLEATPIHENGHNTMARLSILELNRKIDEGILNVDGMDVVELNKTIRQQWENLHELLAKNALESMGLQFSEAEWKRQALTISGYAGSGSYANKTYHYETFSEAALDYYANGANASKFSIAIVEQMKKMSERFGVAADPGVVFAKNGLEAKGLFRDDQYNFPKNVKTDNQKSKWLDGWRQDNPYLKGKGLFDEDSYRKANLWDTYFQKEIRAYNPNSKSTMPDLLAKKNGDFLEDLSANAAKRMVQQIKEASVEGFDENLATMVLSRNSKDVTEAMDNFIIGRVNQSADEIAAKMPGGKTPENINKARATVWSEDSIRNDIINTVATLSPDIDMGNVQSKVNNLFKTQAEGYASFEALPVETKRAVIEAENLSARLAKENNYAKKVGKEVDSKARQKYLGEVTQVISYKQNGEDVYVVVSDPVVASVLKNPNNYKETSMTVETLAQMANFLSRSYRIGTTAISPLAFVRNVLRDPMQAAIQGGFNPLTMSLSPQVFYRTLRGYGLDDITIENVTRRLSDWSGSSTLTAEMKKMGAISPNSISYNSRAGKINRVLDKATSNKIINAAEAPLESWESFFRNQIAQQSFAKNYQRTKNVDKAMAAAMFDASNSTTNFSHSVGLFKRATSTVPYLSSAINGTRSFWTQFNVDPIGMITRVTAGFMVPAMAITAWNLSSKERRDAYMNLPEWYKDSHLVLLDLEGNIISSPIPDELGQYYGTARRLIEYTQDATPYGLSSIMAQGVFGFLPVDVDGFFGEDNTIHWQEGISQAGSTLMPQAATAIYEFIWEKDLYTGQDLSTYDGLNKTINTLSNIFGAGIKNAANDIGMMMGVPEKMLVGKSTADTLARDLFGVGFDNAKTQFMALVGSPETIDANGKETKATGLFAENEKLKKQIEAKDKEIAYASTDRVKELEEEKRDLIKNFTDKVVNLTNKYMSLYTQTGGLEEWQKERLVKLLTLGEAYSSADSTSYQYTDVSEAYLDERSLAQQRYVDAGLPAGPSLASLGQRDTGTFINSIETQAAINRFYGAPKQASTDFDRAVEAAGLKNIRNDFYNAVSKIYDIAEANNETPDYDMIEKIQARYLQAVDSALVPIINRYGISVLNNSSFIDTVEKYVNGMIPSDDWKQSTKNAKKYLSTKEFPTATVNVKKWLIQRYSSGMRDRGLASDNEVVEALQSIKNDIDSGRGGAARGKIESLMKGINRANYYISSDDFKTLSNYYNMLK